MKLIAKFLIAILLVSPFEGCYLFPNNCKDLVYREFTNAEQNFFQYEAGDTIYFINESDAKEYFLYCEYKLNALRDTSYYPDYYCDNGGYSIIRSLNTLNFSSNYQEKNYGPLVVELKHFTVDHDYFITHEDASEFSISFRFSLGMQFRLLMTPETGRLLAEHEYSSHLVEFYETHQIKNKEYKNVYKVYGKDEETLPSSPGYRPPIDTLYFNKTEGIIKLVSKHINLEWILK